MILTGNIRAAPWRGLLRSGDKENFTLLLKAVRECLDEAGDGYMLTIAAGGDAYFTAQTDMKEAVRYLDYVQLMAYDLQGGFQKATGTMRPSISAAGTCRMPVRTKR